MMAIYALRTLPVNKYASSLALLGAVLSQLLFMWPVKAGGFHKTPQVRGPYEVLWQQKHAGTVYFTIGRNLEHAAGVKLLVSNKSFDEQRTEGEESREFFIPVAGDIENEKHVREIMDEFVLDVLKRRVAELYHMEWVYDDPDLFREYLVQMMKIADDHAHLNDHGETTVDDRLVEDEARLIELRQEVEKHPIHKSTGSLKAHTEVEHMLVLFPELLKEDTFHMLLTFYWEHQRHRLKKEKVVERFTHFLLPVTFGLGLTGLIIFATSGTVLIPMAIASLVCAGTLGTSEIGLAIHKWKHEERLGRLGKRFLKFDKKLAKILTRLRETPDLSAEDQAALQYLEQVHAFSEQRRQLLKRMRSRRTFNRLRLATGVIDLLGSVTAVEQAASAAGTMSTLALELSAEHQGLWAALSHNLFETAAIASDGADLNLKAEHVLHSRSNIERFKEKIVKLFTHKRTSALAGKAVTER